MVDLTEIESRIRKLQDIIGTDAGGRGMQALIVPDDLFSAAKILNTTVSLHKKVLILSGFPCCVDASPPTETDGPPGTLAIARACLALGHTVAVVTDDCNRVCFEAACCGVEGVELASFPAQFSEQDEKRFQALASDCGTLIACERVGPAKDGDCYTMRGINMSARGLVAPLHRFVKECKDVPFIAIGDGGNELGMGKVIDAIVGSSQISQGDQIGCVVAANHLIAASVSNWGGYALAAAVALVRAHKVGLEQRSPKDKTASIIEDYLSRCLPTENHEIDLLHRCVAAGCRDGVSGKLDATVDGMPLEVSLQCLRALRTAALGQHS